MKVIHCLNSFLPGQVAGTEVYTQALVKELLERNVETLVLIPRFGENSNNHYYYNETRVIEYAEPSVADRSMIMGNRVPEGLNHFIEIIKMENPDIIHFHVVGGSRGISMFHVKAVKELKIKLIVTMHLAGYSCKTGNLLYKNETACNGYIDIKKCSRCVYAVKGIKGLKGMFLYNASIAFFKTGYNTTLWNNSVGTALGYPFLIKELKHQLHDLAMLSDKLVVLTKWYRQVLMLNNIPPDKLCYISQALPFSEYSKESISDNSCLKLVFIGRINPTKGLHLLIDAIQQLSHYNISLGIYGPEDDAGYTNECKTATEQMPNIRWMGILQPEKIVQHLAGYDCLCLPSVICEMSPLVIQEAFAAGIPVIASDVYGNAEQIVDGKNGWLFSFNSSHHLKILIEALVQNPEKIKEAHKNIPGVKTFKMLAGEYEQLYVEVLSSI